MRAAVTILLLLGLSQFVSSLPRFKRMKKRIDDVKAAAKRAVAAKHSNCMLTLAENVPLYRFVNDMDMNTLPQGYIKSKKAVNGDTTSSFTIFEHVCGGNDNEKGDDEKGGGGGMTGFVSFSTDRHDTACSGDTPATWDSGDTKEVTLDTTALTDNDVLLFRLDTEECARVFCNIPFENGGTLDLNYGMYCGQEAADGNAVNKCTEWGSKAKEVLVLSMRADDQIPVKEYVKGSCTLPQ